MLPFSASLTSFCRNLGQNPSTICLFTVHTGSNWSSLAQSSILSKKPGLLLSKIEHARYLQNSAYFAIVLYTVHCTATGVFTMGSVYRFISRGYLVERWVRGCAAQIGCFFGLSGFSMAPFLFENWFRYRSHFCKMHNFR